MVPCAYQEGGGGQGVQTPLKNHKAIVFLGNNHKATKPAFNVRPSSACQRNFRLRADDGPILVSLLDNLREKKLFKVELDPL